MKHVIDALQYSNWNRARFEEWIAGGLTAVHVTITYWESARETLSNIAKWHQLERRNSDLIRLCRGPEDLTKEDGRTAVIMGAQNCSPIDDELGLVSALRQAGLMVMQLTYNNQSLIGAGCYEKEDPGISRFGKLVIAEMNRVGMIVDLSHSAERTSLEAIDLSARPVAISHANPTSFHDALRNKSDRLIKALAARDGMLGFSLYPLHLKDGSDCALEDFCDMAARTADLIGVDHIGIGSDLCLGHGYEVLEWMRSGRWTLDPDFGEGSKEKPSWPAQPGWFETPADMPKLEQGLRQRGFNETDLEKIMGANWHRFFVEGLEPAP